MLRLRAWVLMWALGSGVLARAGSEPALKPAPLAEIQSAAAQFDYRRALDLAQATLAAGGASEDLTWRLHELAAENAAAVGAERAATDSFMRALELHPAFELVDDASPRLERPFLAAKRALRGRRLRVTATSKRDGQLITTTLVLEGDVLGLVESARLVVLRPQGNETLVLASAAILSRVWRCAETGCAYFVNVLDANGNVLASAGSSAAPLELEELRAEPTRLAARASRPWYRTSWPYLAAGAVLGGTGAYFATRVSHDDGQVKALIAAPSGHFYSELTAAGRSRTRDAASMWTLFGGTAASGAVGLVFAW